ncbi:MAG: TIM barrel protein, partial [Robiginitalea sp.]
MGSRREFLQQSILAGAALGIPGFEVLGFSNPTNNIFDMPKISLAQWSLNRSFKKGDLKAENFPVIAKATFGIGAVEYVNEFYESELDNGVFWQQLRQRADSEGVQSLLIMVDEAGDLGARNKKARQRAIGRHRKWMEASKLLGCHSIRVNAFGKGSREELKSNLVDGLGRLAEEGAGLGMQVLIENHGLHTSDAAFIVDIIRQIDSPN